MSENKEHHNWTFPDSAPLLLETLIFNSQKPWEYIVNVQPDSVTQLNRKYFSNNTA